MLQRIIVPVSVAHKTGIKQALEDNNIEHLFKEMAQANGTFIDILGGAVANKAEDLLNLIVSLIPKDDEKYEGFISTRNLLPGPPKIVEQYATNKITHKEEITIDVDFGGFHGMRKGRYVLLHNSKSNIWHGTMTFIDGDEYIIKALIYNTL